MKRLTLPGLALLCVFFSAAATAQEKVPLNEPDYNKPRLFNNLPDEIAIDIAELGNFISRNTETGKETKLRSANSKVAGFGGKVVSVASKYQNTLRSVVLRLDEFNGATLTLSSSTQPDGTVVYTGRIISFQHGDLYELQKKGEHYFLVKKNYYELINE